MVSPTYSEHPINPEQDHLGKSLKRHRSEAKLLTILCCSVSAVKSPSEAILVTDSEQFLNSASQSVGKQSSRSMARGGSTSGEGIMVCDTAEANKRKRHISPTDACRVKFPVGEEVGQKQNNMQQIKAPLETPL